MVTNWISRHPDTEFDIFFPPYSILFWDKTERLGEMDAVFAAMSTACETLLAYDMYSSMPRCWMGNWC